eukprot:g11764.t1
MRTSTRTPTETAEKQSEDIACPLPDLNLFLQQNEEVRKLAEDGEIVVAALDLDNTLYVPTDSPGHLARQFPTNVEALKAFQNAGGKGFPVTGNSIPMAKKKFDKVASQIQWDLTENAGIFVNGAYVQAPGGDVIMEKALNTISAAKKKAVGSNATSSAAEVVEDQEQEQEQTETVVDGFSALLDFVEGEGVIKAPAGTNFYVAEGRRAENKYGDVGLHFIAAKASYVLAGSNPQPIRGHLQGKLYLTENQDYTTHSFSLFRDGAEFREAGKAPLTAVFVWPVPDSIRVDAKDSEYLAYYETHIEPQQQAVMEDLRGYVKKHYGADSGLEYNLAASSGPWPEVDVNVKGVHKGSAIEAFLANAKVRRSIGLPQMPNDPLAAKAMLRDSVARSLAVFGDAANDAGMFRALPKSGATARLRVGMTGRCKALWPIANVHAEVSEVLDVLTKHLERKKLEEASLCSAFRRRLRFQ